MIYIYCFVKIRNELESSNPLMSDGALIVINWPKVNKLSVIFEQLISSSAGEQKLILE